MLSDTGLGLLQTINISSKIQALVLPIVSAAVLLKYANPDESLTTILQVAVRKWFPLLVGAAALGFLSGLGFLFLLFPGLLATSLFFLFEPMLVCEELDFADCLRQSPQRMKACWGKGIALWTVVMFFWSATFFGLFTIPAALGFLGLPDSLTQSSIVTAVLDVPVNLAAAFAMALKYAAWEATRPELELPPESGTGFTPQ